jgi:hypothetical protein
VHTFASAAKIKTETLRTDPDIFDVWTSFVTAGERLCAHFNAAAMPAGLEDQHLVADGRQLLQRGRDLISDITRARTPMPKSAAGIHRALPLRRALRRTDTKRRKWQAEMTKKQTPSTMTPPCPPRPAPRRRRRCPEGHRRRHRAVRRR